MPLEQYLRGQIGGGGGEVGQAVAARVWLVRIPGIRRWRFIHGCRVQVLPCNIYVGKLREAKM